MLVSNCHPFQLALSGKPGQFLIKDLALLGISLWSLGESWKASERGNHQIT